MSRSGKYHPVPPSRRTHGHSFVNGRATPEYDAWSSMKRRCLNPGAANYARYGGRGIMVCDRWASSFENFLADMGLRPSASHSLDRINNDGNYEPANCRWATNREQFRNKSTNHYVTYAGRRVVVSDLPRLVGLSLATVKRRLKNGVSIDGVLP